MRPMLLALAAALVLAAPAAAADFEGTLAPQYSWSGGPMNGAYLTDPSEPCDVSRTCEEVLLTVPVAGTVNITWKASSPAQQGWLSFTVWRADASGARSGDPVGDGGAFGNEGTMGFTAEPGRYLVEVSALLAAQATYEATAVNTPDVPEVAPAPVTQKPAPAQKPAAKKRKAKRPTCKTRKQKRTKRCKAEARRRAQERKRSRGR